MKSKIIISELVQHQILVHYKRKFESSPRWLLSNKPNIELTRKIAFKLYKCLNTPVALSCFLLLKYEEYDQLVSKGINTSDYECGEKFADDYQAIKFLSKCEDLPTSFDKVKNAIDSELWAELKCSETNKRLISWHRLNAYPTDTVTWVVWKAREILRDILRSTPQYEELVSGFRYGPGASSATSGPDTTIVAKAASALHSTTNAQMDLAYAVQLQPMLDPRYSVEQNFCGPLCGPTAKDIINYSTWTTAPKTAVTARGIATQIHGLMLGQKSLGNILRERARESRYRIDLDNLWAFNKAFAEFASVADTFATIDVKVASSTIAYETVYELLPRSWALLLDRWREPETSYLESVHTNRKFSAMGNGYTFELESLLFFAIAKASALYKQSKAFVSSFGDDIIIPAIAVTTLTEVFEFFGLTVNTTKSFTEGNFRESCGGDYWRGSDVRPMFLKELLSNEESLVKLANRVRHYSLRRGSDCYCCIRFLPLWKCITDLLKGSSYSSGSKHYGDTVLWANAHDNVPVSQPTFYKGGWWTTTVAACNKRRKTNKRHSELRAWFLQKCWDLGFDFNTDILGHYGVYHSKMKRFLSNIDAVDLRDIQLGLADPVEGFGCTSLPRTVRGTGTKPAVRLSYSSVMDMPQNWL